MYNRYFGFKENPFSIAPDPRFLYMSELHQDALAHLNYGLSPDSCIILLTGEVGTGKTTICRRFLEHLDQKTNVAVILNPKLSVLELLSAICDEFQIGVDGNRSSVKSYIDSLNRFLLKAHAQDQRCLLVIDEAQNLDRDVLEMVRLLTNLETNQRKLLKIFLFGQSELSEILARPDMTQIDQRITVRFHLRGLKLNDIKEYISHRVIVAGGGENRNLFDSRAVKRVHHLSDGIPRLINTICDRSLLGAYSGGKNTVDAAIVKKAGLEIFGAVKSSPRIWKLLRIILTVSVAAALLVVLITGKISEFYNNDQIVSNSQKAQPGETPTVPAPLPESVNFPTQADDRQNQQDSPLATTFEQVDNNNPAPAQQTLGNEVSQSLGFPAEPAQERATKIIINNMKISD